MKKYVIAVDLDGTLLNNQGKLSQYTIDVIRRVVALGHYVIITTGRSYRLSQDIYEQLGIDMPIINNNGGLIHWPNKSDWEGFGEYAITIEETQRIVDLQQVLQLGWIAIDTKTDVFVTPGDIPNSDFFPLPSNPKIVSTTQVLDQQPIVVVWFSDESDQAHIKKIVRQSLNKDLELRTWGGTMPCLEVSPPGIHKAFGLKKVLETLNVPLENLIAFGDEHNDFEMLELAPHSVAMKNGIAPVKEIAKYESDYANDEDGVARYLVEFFKLEDA